MTRTVLCFGDSNTHGTMPMAELSDIGRYGRDQRWPGLLAQALPGWQVIEEGHPGRTTLHDDPVEGPHRNGLRVLPALLESHRPLDLVIVKLGTNDLKGRFSVNATDIALSLEKLIAVIRGSGCGPGGAAPAVLLVAPPPIMEVGCLAEIFEGGAAKSRALGAALARAAVRVGVPMVDAADHIAVSDLDGIHYAASAHAALAGVLAQAVRQQFE
jgi:lysophospholipase L1-like esterase